MTALREISIGMYGAWRLALLDRSAMQLFDRSIAGVKRSFLAAPIAYPGFLLLLLLRIDPDTIAASGLAHILLVESIGYVVAWTAFPLVVIAFCRFLGRETQGFDFITAYNWSQILQTILLMLTAGLGLSGLLPEEATAVVELLAYLAILGYEWFIAKVAIGAGGGVATAVVLIDLVLGTVLARITQGLY